MSEALYGYYERELVFMINRAKIQFAISDIKLAELAGARGDAAAARQIYGQYAGDGRLLPAIEVNTTFPEDEVTPLQRPRIATRSAHVIHAPRRPSINDFDVSDVKRGKS